MKAHRSAYQRALISVVLIWMTADSVEPALAAAPQRYVLLLYDSASDTMGNIVVDRTIRSVLKDAFAVNVDVRSEYFEAAAQPHGPAFVDWLKRKYAGTVFDVVVAAGAGAIEFVHEHGRELFPQAQIVCWGRKDSLVDNWTSNVPMTGVVAPDMAGQIQQTVDFIRRLQPDVRRIVVASGASSIDRKWAAGAGSALRSYEGALEISHLPGLSLETLQSQLSRLPDRTAIVFLTISEDGAGRRLRKADVLRLLVQTASAPLYSTSVLDLDTGIVGGVLLSQESLAQQTGAVVARLLRGERVENIPVQEGVLTQSVNWIALRRWGISDDRLPPHTVVINRGPSIWEQHKWAVIAVISLCVLEALLIIALLIHRAHRRRAEHSLIESQRLLQAAHDAQRRLMGLLLRAQDDERRRIARDLHDVTVQNLVAIKAVLRRLEKTSPRLDDKSIGRLVEASRLSDQVIQELRTLCYVLHPPLLDELGLVPALQWFVRGFIERSGIDVELAVNTDGVRLATDHEIALFRVVQESLSNIDRHSGSSRALISFAQDDSSAVLRISDRGRGISKRTEHDRDVTQTPPGVGIVGMRERLNQLGGDLEIQSGDQGTTVIARIPIQKASICRVS